MPKLYLERKMRKILEFLLSFVPPCAFHEFTGLYCPGCGGTRAVRFLVRGNIWKSFIYNPTVLYTVIATFIFFAFVVKYNIIYRNCCNDFKLDYKRLVFNF